MPQAEMTEGEDKLEMAGTMNIASLHAEFFQHRENLYARRHLAVNVSKHAVRPP